VSPQLTLVIYLVAAVSAIWYACLGGLTVLRRIAVSVLALVIEVDAGLLLATERVRTAQLIGVPCVLALGLIMTAPRSAPDRRRPKVPVPVSRQPAVVPRQLGRRPSLNGAPVPTLADPWAALYASMSGHVAYPAGSSKKTTEPVRRVQFRNLSRMSRCRPR
jgi:hypothetical protein